MNTRFEYAHAMLALTACFVATTAQGSTINLNPYYANDRDVAAPTNAVQLIYAPASNMLIERNSASAVAAINLSTGQVSQVLANTRFTDISLSPSGNVLYASDYGGENIGYGTALTSSYVHRLDLASGQWSKEASPIAGNIEAVSDNNFVLKSSDQWVTFTLNAWTSGSSTQQLNPGNGSFSGYYASVYYGNIVYDPATGRLIHGDSGSSSQELQAFKIVNNDFVRLEGSGTYGTAQGNGGSLVLSTDGKSVYYGALQVDALNVSRNQLVFPEVIYSANSKYAFGNGDYYDAKTGVLLGKLGFSTTVYAQGANGDDFWAYDGSASVFRHFAPVPEASTFSLVALGMIGVVCVTRRSRKLSRA